MRHRDLPLVAGVIVAAYFFSLTAAGLGAHFAPDDLQNIYRYFVASPWDVIRANLQVATGFYRPLGALFYLPLFRWFGFNPLPFRVVAFAIVTLNAWLLYCLARRVAGSREAAGFAVLIGCFHASAVAAYYSTAVVYEDLCYLFTAASLLFYTRTRQRYGKLNIRRSVVFLLLVAAALNSKEMAVVIAPALLLWELLYREPRWGRPTPGELAPLLAVVLMTAVYAVVKSSPQDSFTQFEAYRPVFTIQRYFETMSAYTGLLFNSLQPLGRGATVLVWSGLAVVAVAMRNRAMVFGVVFAWIAFLPVNFVTAREGFVLYIPLIGLGIYAGALIVATLDFIRAQLGLGPHAGAEFSAVAFVATLVLLSAAHAPHRRLLLGYMENAQVRTWRMLEEFRDKKVSFGPTDKVYFANSPFLDWDVYFLAKLWARDPRVRVAISGPGAREIRGDVHGDFTRVFRFEDTNLIREK